MTTTWKTAVALAALLLAMEATAAPSARIILVDEKLSPQGTPLYRRREIGQIPGAIRIAVPEGGVHALVLTEFGKVLAWGDNSYGQLGTGDNKRVDGWAPVNELD